MLLIRQFELTVLEFFDHANKSKIYGTTHACIGQEAVAVGVCSALDGEDYITSTHRGHGHFLAKGGDPGRMMAELFGREGGYCRGRGGTQHMCDMSIGYIGSNGITGGGIPIATGAAFSVRYAGGKSVVACFFGDGAANEGYFHESLNFAATHDLPIIFVCENNLYAMSTPVASVFPHSDIAIRAQSYDMDGFIADGMDVLEVNRVSSRAVEKARAGGGPTLIEFKTYRYCGHSKSDMCAYRTREEEEEWKRKDPVASVREMLLERRLLASGELEGLEERVRQTVDRAIEYADKSPWPDADRVADYLFSED
jgi:TPP-dependent pyruvate/acetoin dehydrogenase alpha subunit